MQEACKAVPGSGVEGAGVADDVVGAGVDGAEASLVGATVRVRQMHTNNPNLDDYCHSILVHDASPGDNPSTALGASDNPTGKERVGDDGCCGSNV